MTKPTTAEKLQILAMSAGDYMNPEQRDFFRRLIRHERREILDHIEQMKMQLLEQPDTGDEGDIAIREEQLRLIFRQIDRESRLLPKYNAALLRLEKGEYGFCRETGEPIGLQRLLLRPTAELSIEAKTKEEKVEVQYRKK
ncbi:RNA polymerase-binding protein DksA [Martelella alba]|uniref:RNA polymerase-binding protein DksA n=1 Tax=Martelella alba TaxID=2590451 RepID=A0ABY2SFL9_9HYPH|nr:RNA polymerase-binding protein DksA [Martelella alba]TKI02854.1 RNA polymerase-binding protein DksA [Martelella alba]